MKAPRTTLALLSVLLTPALGQQYSLFNASGMHAFRGPVPSKGGSKGLPNKMPVSFGRGFLVELDDVTCASDHACRDKAIIATKSLDCDGHTFYPGLGLMGMVCFGPPTAGSSRDADAATLTALRSALLAPPMPATATAGASREAAPAPTDRLFKGIDMDRPVRLILPSPVARASVEEEGDQIVSINSTLYKPPGGRGPGRAPSTAPPANNEPATVEATPYNWARDRVNQLYASLDQQTGTCASKGRGVRIYVLDTGCRTSHAEFRTCSGCSATRATTQSVTLSDGSRPYGSGLDGNGHGTHVAGSAAGLNVGTAPLATIRCIKVLGNDGSAPMSYVMAGMDMVARAKQSSPSTPMIINLSLGSGYSSTVNNAVSRLANLGVVVVVAAGNEGQDARYTSPASAAAALTVSATGQSDTRASWANYGSIVDIYAPGVSVNSASYQGDQYYVRMSGTSMATPAAAGAVACVMGTSPSSTCSSSSTFTSKLRNPRVAVSQPGGSTKPLTYLASGSTVRCP